MVVMAQVLLVCGGVIASIAATVGMAFFGLRSWLTWGPLGIGLLTAAGGCVLSWGDLRGAQPQSRVRLVLQCALALLGAGALNALALRLPLSVDVTATQANTLSEASVQVARALRIPVTVRAELGPADRAWRELSELVERYRRELSAPASLVLERVTVDPAHGARAQGARVVVSAGERQQRLRFDAGAFDKEAQLTRALRTVALAARKRVYVLAGHGEASVGDDSADGLRRFGQALLDEGAEVVPLPLEAVGSIPDDAALIVAAATRDVPQASAGMLQRYVDGGGRMFILLEPGQRSGLESLLGAAGIHADDDVVKDESAFAGLLGGPEAATGVAYAAHPVTSRLGGAMTHFLRARSLSVNPGTPAEPLFLVQTGTEAYGETTPGPAARGPEDVQGPLTLLLAVEVPVEGGQAEGGQAEEGQGAGRLVVAGDATFVTNQGIGLGANQDLALNAAMWLLAREDEIAVRPRGRGGNLLLLSPTARERIAFTLLYGVPGLLLCLGMTIVALRRRR